MSAVVKQEQYELEVRIHQAAPDPGVQAIREWAHSALEALNDGWPLRVDEDLTRSQGTAIAYKNLLRIIDDGPKYQPPAELKTLGGPQ